jgi:hypothetical protein
MPNPNMPILLNTEIRLADIRVRRFDIIESNSVERLQQMAAEDEAVFAVLDKIVEEGFESKPRPYCPTVWEHLLQDWDLGDGV